MAGNKNSGKKSTKVSDAKIIDAIRKAKGILTVAATSLGIERRTLYRWIEGNKEIEEVIHHEREAFVDFAESKMLENVKNNDVTSILFLLRTLGKNRGYFEKQEVDQNRVIRVIEPKD